MKSIIQAGQIKDGELSLGRRFEFSPLDIKAIRQQFQTSQREFTYMIGVSVIAFCSSKVPQLVVLPQRQN